MNPPAVPPIAWPLLAVAAVALLAAVVAYLQARREDRARPCRCREDDPIAAEMPGPFRRERLSQPRVTDMYVNCRRCGKTLRRSAFRVAGEPGWICGGCLGRPNQPKANPCSAMPPAAAPAANAAAASPWPSSAPSA